MSNVCQCICDECLADEAERDALRARVAELEALVSLLQTAKEQAEHEHNELALSLPARLRDVAERQREACARRIEWAKPMTIHRDTAEGLAILVRATPLVTEEMP